MTPTTPVQLKAYRTRHTIKVVKDWDDDFSRFVPVCERDGIRVYEREGGFVHDPSEIRQLAALERGEGIQW